MCLIPQWRNWWRRHSFWIGSLMPTITWAREQLPQVQQYLPSSVYGGVMVGLFVAMVLAMQVKQDSVSGGAQ